MFFIGSSTTSEILRISVATVYFSVPLKLSILALSVSLASVFVFLSAYLTPNLVNKLSYGLQRFLRIFRPDSIWTYATTPKFKTNISL
jgi:hypothetical protein